MSQDESYDAELSGQERELERRLAELAPVGFGPPGSDVPAIRAAYRAGRESVRPTVTRWRMTGAAALAAAAAAFCVAAYPRTRPAATAPTIVYVAQPAPPARAPRTAPAPDDEPAYLDLRDRLIAADAARLPRVIRAGHRRENTNHGFQRPITSFDQSAL